MSRACVRSIVIVCTRGAPSGHKMIELRLYIIKIFYWWILFFSSCQLENVISFCLTASLLSSLAYHQTIILLRRSLVIIIYRRVCYVYDQKSWHESCIMIFMTYECLGRCYGYLKIIVAWRQPWFLDARWK